MLCETDSYGDNNIQTPREKARRALIQKVKAQQVQRYYSKARCLNSGESKNLETKLKSIENTQDEFVRSYYAHQRMFKRDRRRQMGTLLHVEVNQEIKCLDEKRRISSAKQSLSIAKDIDKITNKGHGTDDTGLNSVTAILPTSVVTALHDGVPTLISKPRLRQRIKTAHPASRQMQSIAASTSLDSLRYLDRVENSDGLAEMRSRLVKHSDQLKLPSVQRTHLKYPTYLALDPVEHSSIRAGKKQKVVQFWKNFHAGSDDRCNELVKQWLKNCLDTEGKRQQEGESIPEC